MHLSSWRRVCKEFKPEVIMHQFINKEVEVVTSETLYRGILIEIGESEIQMQSENGWITVPMERILDIRLKD